MSLNPRHADLVDRVRTLARERFAPRAADDDRTGRFPRAAFDDLFAAGLLDAALRVDPYSLWMITRELAWADLSLARCWEGHCNALMIVDALGTAAQKARWLQAVERQGERWVAWSGEPRARAPHEGETAGTYIRAVEGGWIIDGVKLFATSATGAQWAILHVNLGGPGGSRHAPRGPAASPTADASSAAGAASLAGVLMLACPLSDPTVKVDETWWDPLGMRASASHLVRFEQTFVPTENCIGEPDAYLSQGWQTRVLPHYAASFLGAAQAAYDYTLAYVQQQDRTADPYVQHRIAKMSVALDTGLLWLHHTASLWDRPAYADAASRVRHVAEHVAEDVVANAVRACGARSLIRPSSLERIVRDVTIYLRHDNDDHVLATIGRAALGLEVDLSFHRP